VLADQVHQAVHGFGFGDVEFEHWGGAKRVVVVTFWVQSRSVKRSIDLDDDLAADIDRAATLVREKPATIMRLAIRAGLPAVTNRFQAPRPEGYFKDAYPLPDDRLQLEKAMSKVVQRAER